MEPVGEHVPFSRRGQLVDSGEDEALAVLYRDLLEAAGNPELVDALYHSQGSALFVGDLAAQKIPRTNFWHRI